MPECKYKEKGIKKSNIIYCFDINFMQWMHLDAYSEKYFVLWKQWLRWKLCTSHTRSGEIFCDCIPYLHECSMMAYLTSTVSILLLVKRIQNSVNISLCLAVILKNKNVYQEANITKTRSSAFLIKAIY